MTQGLFFRRTLDDRGLTVVSLPSPPITVAIGLAVLGIYLILGLLVAVASAGVITFVLWLCASRLLGSPRSGSRPSKLTSVREIPWTSILDISIVGRKVEVAYKSKKERLSYEYFSVPPADLPRLDSLIQDKMGYRTAFPRSSPGPRGKWASFARLDRALLVAATSAFAVFVLDALLSLVYIAYAISFSEIVAVAVLVNGIGLFVWRNPRMLRLLPGVVSIPRAVASAGVIALDGAIGLWFRVLFVLPDVQLTQLFLVLFLSGGLVFFLITLAILVSWNARDVLR